MSFSLRNKLKTLCDYGDGWSYAILWRFHERNPMLLTMEETYYEEQLREEIQKLLPQVHLLGEGIVGEVGFTGKHRWLHSISCEDDSGLYQQFSSGIIKTIVVIPVKEWGVVQFGSRNKILETMNFLDQTQSLLEKIDNIDAIDVLGNEVLSIDFTNDDLNALLASISHENSCEENITSLEFNLSFLSDPLEGTIEEYLDPNSSINNSVSINTPLFGETFGIDSLEEQLTSEIMAQEVCISMDNKHSSESNVVVKDVDLPSSSNSIESIDMSEDLLKFSSIDDLCEWFVPSPKDNNNNVNTLSVNDFLDNKEFDLGCDQGSELWENLLTPNVSDVTDINTGFSECISELNDATPIDNTRKRLFSELGIEELLRDETSYNNSFNSSKIENALSSCNKKPMVEFSPLNRTQAHFETRTNLMHSVSDLNKLNSVLSTKKDTFSKLQVGMLVNDRNSINIKRVGSVHPKKPEEPAKHHKKKAKPGESTRPRPKDRQQIQDCIKELRGIIPHGGKCSIDSLLDRTIRYMIFLRSVIKYADILHEPNEPKLIDQANGLVPKDNNVGENKNHGATWAFEVANQTMVCPIIVEDMNPPGQMLIEMLCEDQGFFLEIVDIIRGFGLSILKAKMEKRKKKLWAQFIVEANRHVTRIDVFWSLIHLLQRPNVAGMDSSNKHCNVIDGNID